MLTCFNPRTYIRYDLIPSPSSCLKSFQSTYLYKVRQYISGVPCSSFSFNPRTYIRYDLIPDPSFQAKFLFQSTYLYKVRLSHYCSKNNNHWFQSTYLYKVRPRSPTTTSFLYWFQSTYLYKVRPDDLPPPLLSISFQSTYLYKVRPYYLFHVSYSCCFNPRTYIRYDQSSASD